MKTILPGIALAALFFFAPSAKADLLAGVLKTQCSTPDNFQTILEALHAGMCQGYLRGFLQATDSITASDKKVYVLKFEDNVTTAQMQRVFLLYIAKHPETENKVAYGVVFQAMIESGLMTCAELKR